MTETVTQPAKRIQFQRDDCLLIEKALTREWLETNGLGGYASSTILMCPTRRYHGLLVVPPPGSVKRHVFLSRFEERMHGEDKTIALSMARYPGTWEPQGHKSLLTFELAPWPRARYRVGAYEIIREILMVQAQPTVLCRYHIVGPKRDVELRLRPLLPFREADALTHENLALDSRIHRLRRGIRAAPYEGLPPLTITTGGATTRFEADPVWYREIEYRADLARGYDGHEDQFNPGILCVPLGEETDLVVAATIGEPVEDPVALWKKESERRSAAFEACGTDLRSQQELVADAFLYRDGRGRLGVIAGWPWFQEWGRDTFISLPGLTLARGRVDQCEEALVGAQRYLEGGLLPNIFGGSPADSHYGSADAALWFARAVRLYEQAGGQGIRERFLPALVEIASSYRDGTGLGIRCDEDCGLLHAGAPDLNPTWMDARTPAGPVTPRHGYAVELNALWYFLLAYLEKLCAEAGDPSGRKAWGALRLRAKRGFLERFWLPDGRYLADCWRDGAPDRSVRSNMVIAAALEFSPLTRGKRTDVVDHAEAELLTPRGLRTLAPKNPAYIGRYAGGPEERDAAYHQGTVWPWLIGFFCEAYLRAHAPTRKRIEALLAILDRFGEHVPTYGLGFVSEVFDGDPPHRPGGTIAQAWNTAELLRAYRLVEDAQ